MNPITIFLTIACAAVGAALGAMGHLYLVVFFAARKFLDEIRARWGKALIAD
jgi:hypothetical protein